MRLRNTVAIKDGQEGQNWEERALAEKITVEQKVVDGSGKFLGACKSVQERLEAAKTLQLSKLRIDMLKYELNKVRRGRGSPPLGRQQGKPSYGGVCLSDVRIPLVWRPVSKVPNSGLIFSTVLVVSEYALCTYTTRSFVSIVF